MDACGAFLLFAGSNFVGAVSARDTIIARRHYNSDATNGECYFFPPLLRFLVQTDEDEPMDGEIVYKVCCISCFIICQSGVFFKRRRGKSSQPPAPFSLPTPPGWAAP